VLLTAVVVHSLVSALLVHEWLLPDPRQQTPWGAMCFYYLLSALFQARVVVGRVDDDEPGLVDLRIVLPVLLLCVPFGGVLYWLGSWWRGRPAERAP
jgi:hypothetical protein